MRRYRILLADDHAVLRAGLAALLERQGEFEIVAEAESADEALALAASTAPDIAILDVRMPGGGIEATRRLKRQHPRLAVLILSQYNDAAYLHEALEAGASGYALKQAGAHELLDALRTLIRGDVYLHAALTRVLVDETRNHSSAAPSPGQEVLSDRELHVLRLVALGYTTAEIAQQLVLSVRTVETYKIRGLNKLDLRGRAALVRHAVEQGWLGEASPLDPS